MKNIQEKAWETSRVYRMIRTRSAALAQNV